MMVFGRYAMVKSLPLCLYTLYCYNSNNCHSRVKNHVTVSIIWLSQTLKKKNLTVYDIKFQQCDHLDFPTYSADGAA